MAWLGGFVCSRHALIGLNILYIIVSFILIGTAAYARVVAFIVDYSIVGGIIACGVILLIIALVGLLGTGLHHQAMLFVYMIVLILLFIVQLSVACACLALKSEQQKSLFQSAWTTTSYDMKSKMQIRYVCCGLTDQDQNDFMNETQFGGRGHPPCIVSNPSCNETCCTGITQSNSTFVDNPCTISPCWDKVEDDVRKAVRAVGGIGLFFSFTELVGIWLAYRYRNLKNPNVDPNSFL